MGMNRRKRRELSNEMKDRDIPEVDINWQWLLSRLKPYGWYLSFAFVALVISSALSLIFPAVVGGVGDIPGVLSTVLQDNDIQLLNTITIILMAVFFVRSLTSLVQTYFIDYVGERVVVDLRKELYAHLQTMSLKFFTDRRVGELVSRISSDVTVVRTALTNNVNTLLQQAFIMIGSVIIMFVLNWQLSLFIIVLIPVIIGIAFGFGYYLRRISTEVQDEIAGATTVAEEVLQNIREVKSFVREPFEVKRYSQAIDRAFNAALKLLRVRALFGPTVAFLSFGGLTMILWFGGREVLAGRLSPGELIAFLLYGVTVGGSFASLVGLYSQFQEAMGATKRVFQILHSTPVITDKPDAHELDKLEGHIVFDHVDFSYDGRQQVLYDINLDIAPGEIIALVGPSGAGKSTTFNLIPRFYDVTGGALRIDGYDVRDVTQYSLRSQIGIVPQETLLFGESIRENILYGRLDATEEELIAAAQAANAHQFIVDMPDGYDTMVGERGVRLSGGQRQRVAIARAILKDPRILLLDEATSSLDNESEHLVQEALTNLMKNRTTIIIAHRLSTIRVANRIVVLDKGHIRELGTHDELMSENGLYAKLYEMQFREDDWLAAGD